MGAERKFRVWRGDSAGGQLEDFKVEVNEGEVVLDVIHRLQATQAPDLAVRWNCKAGKCGSCSMEINGKPRLGCMTRMSTFDASRDGHRHSTADVPGHPRPGHRRLVQLREGPRDAGVRAAGRAWRPGEYRMQQVDVERSQEFRKCIECFLCQNTCHVVRDHEENKPAFSGPRFFIRAAELDMHPLDAKTDRKEFAQQEQGLGFCNITKCCTEVCPEHIKITDNAIIPMKERVVDNRYDPLVWLGRKIFRRDELAAQGAAPQRGPQAAQSRPHGHTPRSRRRNRHHRRGFRRTTSHPASSGTHRRPDAWTPRSGRTGRCRSSEVAFDRPGAASPFGEDMDFPLPSSSINYQHPAGDE